MSLITIHVGNPSVHGGTMARDFLRGRAWRLGRAVRSLAGRLVQQ